MGGEEEHMLVGRKPKQLRAHQRAVHKVEGRLHLAAGLLGQVLGLLGGRECAQIEKRQGSGQGAGDAQPHPVRCEGGAQGAVTFQHASKSRAQPLHVERPAQTQGERLIEGQ